MTNFIWAVQMPGFMLVAGYFSARKVHSISEVRTRITNAAQHYALPFLSWFFLISTLLLGGNDRNLFSAAEALFAHVDRGLWFLWVVFILSIIATLCNFTIRFDCEGILKTGLMLMVSFGFLGGVGLCFGINFLGIKFILYYAVFYGFGWLMHKTEIWWKSWFLKAENAITTVAFIIFLAIVYNYDLYHAQDNLIGIALRCVSGFTGNLVLLQVCRKYKVQLNKIKLGRIGMYTLEIYTTHMYVNALMTAGNTNGFFTVLGFENFLFSLVLTVLFTGIITAVFKSVPVMDFLFYGKSKT